MLKHFPACLCYKVDKEYYIKDARCLTKTLIMELENGEERWEECLLKLEKVEHLTAMKDSIPNPENQL